MKKTLWVVLILLVSVSAFAITPEMKNTQTNSEDCGRMVEASPGYWAPLNLCPDGTLPLKGCVCPGKVKWDPAKVVPVSNERTVTKSAQFHQPATEYAVPEGTDLVQYPIVGKKDLNPRRVAEMGLRPDELKEAMIGYNYHRDLNRFVYEVLPKGTIVYAENDGTPIYKADCANRLAQVVPCPKCSPVAPTSIGSATIKPTDGKNAKGNSAGISGNDAKNLASTTGWSLLGGFLKNLGGMIVALGKFAWNWLLPLLILAAILFGIPFIVYRAIRDERERRRREREEIERREREALEDHERREGGSVVPGPVSTAPRMPIVSTPAATSSSAIPFVPPPPPRSGSAIAATGTLGSGAGASPVRVGDDSLIPVSTRGVGESSPGTPSAGTGHTGSDLGSDEAAMKFVAFYPATRPGGEAKLRTSGFKSVTLNEKGGITTITMS